MTKYTLPDLPYDYSALEPVISAEIMELHHKKHHQGYVNNLNTALEKYAEAEAKNDLETMVATQNAIKFNGGGHINHSIFWSILGPVKDCGGRPEGELLSAIEKDFGSFENFSGEFNTKTAAIQGSGWGWLGYCKEKKGLKIVTCQNQDPLSVCGMEPIFGVDVWEHAYYLQYKNVRPDYLKAIWQILNWKNIAERYNKAVK